MVLITEMAPDLFQITTFVEPYNLQFSQFLVRDEEPREVFDPAVLERLPQDRYSP